MIELMKCTYLMDVKKIEKELDNLWNGYQSILINPSWDELNRARAILYLTGQIYCEKIAPEAIERRLSHLKQPLTLTEFFLLIDSNSEKLVELRKDSVFKQLEAFYIIIKKYKNKNAGGKYYLDEEKFIEIYNKHTPTGLEKTSYKGIIELKKDEV